ncbi:MAG: BON domain-containing protein [Planctomycetota bacterium]|jgi:osmotically-inducible protein OsmY
MPSEGDATLATKVREKLRENDHVSSAEFLVTVHDGRVRLEGTVPRYSEKLAAIQVVASLPDVKGLEDAVAVEPPTRLSDVEVARLVSAALAEHAEIPERNISVAAKKGHVSLSGNVPSILAWYTAQETALACEGVLSVANLLLVDPVAVREDGEIVDEIVDVLEGEKHLDPSGVEVKCIDGRVVLSGWVSGLSGKLRAERAVTRVHGIRSLTNAIRIR